MCVWSQAENTCEIDTCMSVRIPTPLRPAKVHCWHVHLHSAFRFPFFPFAFFTLSQTFLTVLFLSFFLCGSALSLFSHERKKGLSFYCFCLNGPIVISGLTSDPIYLFDRYFAVALVWHTCIICLPMHFYCLFQYMQTDLCNVGVYVNDIKPKRNQITRKKSAEECVSAFLHSLLSNDFSFQLFVAQFSTFHIQLCCVVPSFPEKKYGFCRFMWYFFGKKILAKKLFVCVCYIQICWFKHIVFLLFFWEKLTKI